MRCLSILQVGALLLMGNIMCSGEIAHKSSAAETTSQLSGSVTDTNESRIVNAKVTLEGNGFTRTVITAEDGTYRIDLPTGLYRISVQSPGFCPSRRTAFKVQRSTAVIFDFTLLVCPLEHVLAGKNGKYSRESDRYKMAFKEEVLTVESAPFSLLIQFGERLKDKNVIQYKGIEIDGKCLGAVVSYDLLTIHADKVRFNKQTFQLEAEGSVIVDDGKRRTRAKKAEVEFKAGKQIVKLIQ